MTEILIFTALAVMHGALLTFIHETSHYAAAVLNGAKGRGIKVGMLGPSVNVGIFELHALPVNGLADIPDGQLEGFRLTLTALAGPATNLATAAALYALMPYPAAVTDVIKTISHASQNPLTLQSVLAIGFYLNLYAGIFNLIPLPGQNADGTQTLRGLKQAFKKAPCC